jgi:hypothetical protein
MARDWHCGIRMHSDAGQELIDAIKAKISND